MTKLGARLKYIWKLFSKRGSSSYRVLLGYGFDLQSIAIISVLLLLCTGFVYSIYNNLAQVPTSYAVLEAEQERLSRALDRQSELDSEIEYYSSLEYRRRYAYDSLNFVREGEEIYLVDLDGRFAAELELTNPDPIELEEGEIWWEILFSEFVGQLML